MSGYSRRNQHVDILLVLPTKTVSGYNLGNEKAYYAGFVSKHTETVDLMLGFATMDAE